MSGCTDPGFCVEEWQGTRCQLLSFEISPACLTSWRLGGNESDAWWREGAKSEYRTGFVRISSTKAEGMKRSDDRNVVERRERSSSRVERLCISVHNIEKGKGCVCVCMYDTAQLPKKKKTHTHVHTQKAHIHSQYWEMYGYWFFWCSKLPPPTRPVSSIIPLLSSHRGWVWCERTELFRALHPLCSSAGEPTAQLIPIPTQTLRSHLMPFQTDLNL